LTLSDVSDQIILSLRTVTYTQGNYLCNTFFLEWRDLVKRLIDFTFEFFLLEGILVSLYLLCIELSVANHFH